MTNTIHSVPQYATIYTGTVEVHRFDDGEGTTYLAAESTDRPGYTINTLDGCGLVTIAPTGRRDRNTVEARPCCKWCDSTRELADRLNTAYSMADEQYEGDEEKAVEAMLKVIQRGNLHAHIVTGGLDWAVTAREVTDADDMGLAFNHDGQVIVADFDTEAHARETAAYLNGVTWEVGTMETAHIDEDEDDYLAPNNCTTVVSGLVWDNADEQGYSTPTAEEVLNRC